MCPRRLGGFKGIGAGTNGDGIFQSYLFEAGATAHSHDNPPRTMGQADLAIVWSIETRKGMGWMVDVGGRRACSSLDNSPR